MRFATTTEFDEMLHRQDRGTTTTYCNISAVYDMDQDAATFGLLAGTLFICPRCEAALARSRGSMHGARPQDAHNDDVQAAVSVLALAGFEPARTTDPASRGTGFLVTPFGAGRVTVYRLDGGRINRGAGAHAMHDAYERTLRIAGWHTHRTRNGTAVVAQRPAEDEVIVTTVTPEHPNQHPDN